MTRAINVAALQILKSAIAAMVWCVLLASFTAVAMSFASGLFNVVGRISPVLVWLFIGLGVLFYFINIKSISRSLRAIFDTRRVIVLTITTVGMYTLAMYVDNLLPDQQSVQAAWGWLSFGLLLLLDAVIIAKLILPTRTEETPNVFFLDDPSDGKLPLTDTQKVVYDRMKLVLDQSADASLALTGNWGTGKTKILHNLKEHLPDSVLWFPFYPWAYVSEEALIKDFYTQLLIAIDERAPQVSFGNSKITSSLRRLIDGRVMGNFLSVLANIFVDFIGHAQNPEDIIHDRLKDEQLKIIVVIDDLERVKDDAIINRTLQLVHHLRRRGIDGISFITAFEREAILGALPKHVNEAEKSNFIEKFFDMEVMLPDPLPSDLEKQLVDLLPAALRPNFVRQTLLRDLKSHRAVIRLANEYRLSESIKTLDVDLNNIVNMDDFLVLTHIKLKYPFIYRDIAQNRSIYTQYNSELDEEAIWYYMMKDEERDEYKRQHVDALFERYSLPKEVRESVKKMLVDIFPDMTKALGEIGSRSSDSDSQRRERRVGLRMVLDAALGMFGKLSQVIDHESEVKKVIGVMERDHTEDEMRTAVSSLVDYSLRGENGSWDAALHILTSEIESRDELHDYVPELAKVLLEAALKLGITNDSDGTKVRIMGQAFYIFTDTLLYRGITDEKKKSSVKQLSLLELTSLSKTPYGSLLLARLQLSREATAVKGYLNGNELTTLRRMSRRHFEEYYIEQGHDMIDEAGDLFEHLNLGWQEVTKKYPKGKKTHAEWLSSMQVKHPGYFLDKFTTKTYRGNWAFKEDDFGTIKPVQNITSEKLKDVTELVAKIELSNNLSDDDLARIKMIRQYAETHSEEDQEDVQSFTEI